MSRLEALARVPRALTDELWEVCGRPFFLFAGTKRWEQEVAEAPLVLAAVVQADSALFVPLKRVRAEAQAVLVYSNDSRFALDRKWILDLAERLGVLGEREQADTEEARLAARLNETRRRIQERVPLSLTGGVEARLSSACIAPKLLPRGHLERDTVLPSLIVGGWSRILPPKMYT